MGVTVRAHEPWQQTRRRPRKSGRARRAGPQLREPVTGPSTPEPRLSRALTTDGLHPFSKS